MHIQDYSGGTVDPGTQIVNVKSGTELTSDPGAPIIIMGAGTSANVTFGADSSAQTVILGNGANNVTFEGDNNVTVETGGGTDSIATGNGADNIVFKGGDATISTGNGDDQVTLQGEGSANVTGGDGNMVITLQTDETTATINAGDGFDQLRIAEGRSAHTFEIKDGKVVMHSDGAITMSNVNVVGFDTNNDGQITSVDDITVIAENANDSIVAKLYKVALGREAIDGADGWGGSTLGGINWWMTQFEKQDRDQSTEQLVRSFLNCDEFHSKYDGMSNADYVNTLFANLGFAGTAADNAKAAYLQALDSGAKDRAQVAWGLAASEDTVEILGIDGDNYVIDAF